MKMKTSSIKARSSASFTTFHRFSLIFSSSLASFVHYARTFETIQVSSFLKALEA